MCKNVYLIWFLILKNVFDTKKKKKYIIRFMNIFFEYK